MMTASKVSSTRPDKLLTVIELSSGEHRCRVLLQGACQLPKCKEIKRLGALRELSAIGIRSDSEIHSTRTLWVQVAVLQRLHSTNILPPNSVANPLR